ncbi:MAG: hypothetical protein ACC651_15880 [Candidatus Scalindua sp.]
MRDEIKNALDNEQAKDRNKYILSLLFLVGLAGTFGALFYPASVKTVYGVTEAYTAEQTEMGSKERVTILLETGEKVLAKFPRHLVYRKGVKVELIERQALMGKRSYSVIQYAE